MILASKIVCVAYLLCCAVVSATKTVKTKASVTVKRCLEKTDPYEGIECFLARLRDGNIDKSTADSGIKHFTSKLSVERFLYAIGFNNNFGIEMGVYNDPSGKYVELHQRYLRYGKPDVGVTHQKPQHKYSITYSWNDLEEPEPFNHWSSYTALKGSPGYNLAYAHSGKAKGIKGQDNFKTDCGGVSDIMRLQTKYFEHVSIFMGADKLCLEKKGDYDIIIGKYDKVETTYRGRKVETYAPTWECYLGNETLDCYGVPNQEETSKINKMLDTLN